MHRIVKFALLTVLAQSLLALSAISQYTKPVSLVGINPSGKWMNVGLDSTGALAAPGKGLSLLSDQTYPQPVAPMAQSPSGNMVYLQVDSTGALKLSLPPVTMPQQTSLQGQFLVNEGSGTTLLDTSGNGNNASFSGFTWESATDLDNTTANGSITFPRALNTFKTAMIAFYVPIFGNSAYPQAPGYGGPGNFNVPTILCGTISAQPCFVAGNDYYFRKNYRFYSAGGGDNTEAIESMPSGWHTWSVVCAAQSHYYYDGQEVGGYVAQGTNACGTATTASGNMNIGTAVGVYNSNTFLGKIAGAWFWSTPLNQFDVAASAKLALDYIHVKGVPYGYRGVTTTNPRILAGIDSRTWGVNLTPSTVWPTTMNLTDTYDRVNLAQPSETALDTCAQFELLYGQQAGNGPVITVLWGWANDAQINAAVSARDIANSMKCLVQKAKKIGRVILATDISLTVNSVTARYDATKNAVNAIVRAEAFGWGVDNLADLAMEPTLGADNASLNTTYFVDGAHQTLAGEAKLTPIFESSVNELIGSTESAHHTSSAATVTEIAGDRYFDLNGTVAQTVTIPTCIGKTLPRFISNVGTSSATIALSNSETLVGSATITVGSRATLLSIPGALSTGGCTWRRL